MQEFAHETNLSNIHLQIYSLKGEMTGAGFCTLNGRIEAVNDNRSESYFKQCFRCLSCGLRSAFLLDILKARSVYSLANQSGKCFS